MIFIAILIVLLILLGIAFWYEIKHTYRDGGFWK